MTESDARLVGVSGFARWSLSVGWMGCRSGCAAVLLCLRVLQASWRCSGGGCLGSHAQGEGVQELLIAVGVDLDPALRCPELDAVARADDRDVAAEGGGVT